MRIDNREIDCGKPVFIVAEAGINHNGSIEIAKEMIEVASSCRVDAIKFQTLFPEELFSERTNPEWFEMIKKWSLTKTQHLDLMIHAKKNQIEFFSTPVGIRSAKLLKEINVKTIKIASGELTNHDLIRFVAKTRIPMILSTGMSTLSEILAAVDIIKNENCPFVLLHCNASYPSPVEDANLLNIPYLRNIFDVPVGYSDHTIGNETCLAAVSLGACIIEKHFTLNKKMEGPDQKLSADPKNFEDLVSKIRIVEKTLGKVRFGPTNSEKKFRKTMRKSVAAKIDLKAGTKIKKSMLSLIRPGVGISPALINNVVGCTIKTNVKRGTLLDWNMF